MTMARPGLPPSKIPAYLSVLACVVFAALSLSTNAATRFYQWPWFFYWQMLLVAPIATLAGRLIWRAHLERFGGWTDGGLALLVAANVLAALLSPLRPLSLNLALIPVAGVSLAYLCLDWIEHDTADRARRAALFAEIIGASMMLFVAVSFGLWLFARVLPAWSAGATLGAALRIRNEEPLGHSLYTAGAAVLSAPWLAALGLSGPHRWRRLRLSTAALAFALIPTTSSRGGVLAAIAMVVCAGIIWLAPAGLSRRQRLLVGTGALAAAVLVVVLDPRLNELILHRQWGSAATESNRQHAAMLRAGWLMGCERPLVGYGPGTVPRVYPHYRAQLSGGTDDVLQLHNAPAQFWAELGLPGIAAVVLVLIGLVKCGRGILPMWQGHLAHVRGEDQRGRGILPMSEGCSQTTGETSLRQGATAGRLPVPLIQNSAVEASDPRSGERQQADSASTAEFRLIRAQAVLIAFAGYAVMSLFDYQLDVPWFTFTAAGLLVILRISTVAPAAPGADLTVSTAAARLAGALLLTGLAFMVWPTARDLRARQLFSEAADVRETGDTAAFVAGAERAAAIAPHEPFYPTQLAAFYSAQYLQAGNETDRARAHDRCCEFLHEALRIDPDQDYCHFNLGWLLLAQQPAEAGQHFRASARLSPYRGGVYLGLGLSLMGRNDDAAARAFALEWANDPHAVTSPLWAPPPFSDWRDRVATKLQSLAGRWLDDQNLSDSDRAQIRYVSALTDWWVGRSVDVATLIHNSSPKQRRFFQNLDAIERRSYAPAKPGALEPWEQLYVAWRDEAIPAALDAEQPAFSSALRRKIGEHRASFIRLLTAPTAGESALVRLGQNERPGYSILARNQDGFPLRDLYIYPENLVVEKFASFLFPPKGCIPDRLLLEAVSEILPVMGQPKP
jgi:tetratricopeptide (TPR) repeat protein